MRDLVCPCKVGFGYEKRVNNYALTQFVRKYDVAFTLQNLEKKIFRIEII